MATTTRRIAKDRGETWIDHTQEPAPGTKNQQLRELVNRYRRRVAYLERRVAQQARRLAEASESDETTQGNRHE